ncbi:MAG: T9SS type A sorting domain-containing protein [Saprospiraceae bacterium]|nr:T9SS type A sorting domain-containing protein [Saprospiraceae bacterium]
MKLRLISLLFFGALCFIILPGNKNGRASESQKGNTGAPGDESNTNGSPRTCSYCHFGAAGPVTFIHLIDTNGDSVTQYLPGQQYKARVSMSNSNTNLTGYGFQMIALRDSNNSDLDGFSDPGNNTVNNYKIATIPNGRTYAEHDNISSTPVFDVVWTAPPQGTGPVTFYAAGNAVNRNGTTSGDGTDSEVFHVNEAIPAGTTNPGTAVIPLSLWPNPATNIAYLNLQLQQGGIVRLSVFNLNGQLCWESKQSLEAGLNSLQLPVATWKAGTYVLEVSNGNQKGISRLVKI